MSCLDPAALIGFRGAPFCSAKRFRGTLFLVGEACVSGGLEEVVLEGQKFVCLVSPAETGA